MKKTVIELFAGVGGFRVGLNDVSHYKKDGKAIEKKDWDFAWTNQYEPSTKSQDAYECYIKRFGENNADNRDINEVDKANIPNHALLVGGFPCQDYSVARGKSGEKGIQGKKGVLFWQISDILEVKKSPFVLLENVDRLLKSPAKQRGRDFGIMLRTFSDLKYNVEWRVINAAEYGFPQRRRRVYIFAWKQNTKYNASLKDMNLNELILHKGIFAKAFPIEEMFQKTHEFDITEYKDTVDMTESFSSSFENSGIMIKGKVLTVKTQSNCNCKIKTLRTILDKETELNNYYLNDNQIKKFATLRGSKKILRINPKGEEYYYAEGSMSPFDDLNLPGRTMLTSESSVNRSTHILKDPTTNKLRLITPIEAERMQCFPDNWTQTGMSEKKRYFMMGNALVTGLIKKIEPILSEIIERE